MNCKNCKHWKLKDYPPRTKETGFCTRLKMFWDATEWNYDKEGEELERSLKEEFQNEKAFLQDGSDYKAYLITMHDFGCVQFENKQL